MKLKIKGTELTISYLLLCIAAISLILGLYKSFVHCVLAVVIHETGHLLVMVRLGFPPQKIKVSMFEINISDCFRQSRTTKENLLIIFFGPIANFICFILFFLLYLFVSDCFLPFAIANLSVGLFNIMPAMSLDGGQILYILLCKRFSERTSERLVTAATIAILLPLSVVGFIVLFNSRYNFSLLFVCAYLMMSLICKNNQYY